MYLIVNRVYGTVTEKNGIKFLSFDKGDAALKKYDQVFAGIKYHIGKIKFGGKLPGGVDVNYNAGHEKIKILTDDSFL